MRICKIISQHRRDFSAVFECEHCGFQVIRVGYDDKNFHHNVIPNMICDKCGKKGGRKLPTARAEISRRFTNLKAFYGDNGKNGIKRYSRRRIGKI